MEASFRNLHPFHHCTRFQPCRVKHTNPFTTDLSHFTQLRCAPSQPRKGLGLPQTPTELSTTVGKIYPTPTLPPKEKRGTEFIKFLSGSLPDSLSCCLTRFNVSQGSPWVCADLLGYSHGHFLEKQSQEELSGSRDLHHQPMVVLLSADSSCGAELMEMGKKSQGQHKEPFRCSIQNIKVTESFCTEPRGAKFCMNEGGTEVPHPPSGAIHADRRPSTREKTYSSWPPCLASSELFPRRVPCILSNFMLKLSLA